MSRGRILLADDDADLRRSIRESLAREGYETETASDGEDALGRYGTGRFDLVITDLAMPRLDGLGLVKALRSGEAPPILVLSARDSEAEIVRLLDAGADDYITKPFRLGELLARVRALIRRGGGEAAEGPLRAGPIALDRETRTASVEGRPVRLTPTEFELLAALLKKPGAVLTHRQLIGAVWGSSGEAGEESLRVHIAALRRKLEPDPARPRWIRTEPWVGYRLTAE